ncbi:MAG: hypothetical protein AAFQ94_15535 [Bacteroidota bacterium]
MRITFILLSIITILNSCSDDKKKNSLADHLKNKTGENWQVLSTEQTELNELKLQLDTYVKDLEILVSISENQLERENQISNIP